MVILFFHCPKLRKQSNAMVFGIVMCDIYSSEDVNGLRATNTAKACGVTQTCAQNINLVEINIEMKTQQ